MKQVIDLHIHSKYSRACSPNLDLENIYKACKTKGVNIITTADFTHPLWFKQLKNNLEQIGKTGLYKLKKFDNEDVKFISGTELSCVYSKNGKTRRVHIVVLAPNLDVVEEINNQLGKKFRLDYDGRPILGIDTKELFKLLLKIDKRCMLIPAHIWTPWFGILGSKSGFNSIDECFEEMTDEIYSIETGLSSDPEMNWRLSALDKFTLVSNSDAHSLQNIAREANVMEMENPSYEEICNIIKMRKQGKAKQQLRKFLYTIEFYPEEGMYHLDGHRLCNIRFTPEQSRKNKNICPVCKKPLTIGVLNRVEQLADRKKGEKPSDVVPFKKLIELDKIIAESMGIKSRNSKAVQKEFMKIISQAGNELAVLIDLSYEELEKITSPKIVEAIRRVREEKLIIQPGFDGQYGSIKIFSDQEKKANKQKKLF